MKISKLLTGALLSLISTVANAALVTWTPTDGDVNYTFDFAGVGDTNLYALFDVDDFDATQAQPLVLFEPADTIDFVASGSDYSATSTVTANSITLFNDNQFVVAASSDSGGSWFEANGQVELVAGTNIYNISFNTGTVLSIDAVPAVVPLPAAAWLFTSGLIGLVAVSRRKV